VWNFSFKEIDDTLNLAPAQTIAKRPALAKKKSIICDSHCSADAEAKEIEQKTLVARR